MKRFVSMILFIMMLVSLLAVNVSAEVIENSYTVVEGAVPEKVYVSQDFDNIQQNADFTTMSVRGKADVSEGVLTLTAGDSTEPTFGSVYSDSPITTGNFKLNFDIRKNDILTATPYTLYVTFQRGVNAESSDANLKKNGICLPVTHLTTGKWYEYEFTFSEDTYLSTNDITKMITGKYREKGTTKWTAIYHAGSWNPSSNKFRSAGSNTQSLGEAAEISIMLRALYGMKEEEKLDDVSYSLDNIKVYNPEIVGTEVTYDYPLVKGTSNLVRTQETVINNYSGNNANPGEYKFTSPLAVFEKEGETRRIEITFDAMNSVKGMPICIHVGGSNVAYGFEILSKDNMLNKWYTYKAVFTETYGDTNLELETLSRKQLDAPGEWEVYDAYFSYKFTAEERSLAPVAGWWNDHDVTNAIFHVGGSPGKALNAVRIVWKSNSEEFADKTVEDLTATTWTFRNIQVITDAYAAGVAKLEDGTLNIDADFNAAIVPAMPILAVYDGGRLKDVDFENYAAGLGKLKLSADYEDGNSAKIFIWKNFEGTVGIVPWDITNSIVSE